MNKYFVSKDYDEFNVIYEAWDDMAGNHYGIEASGFETEEAAQDHANKLNKKVGK